MVFSGGFKGFFLVVLGVFFLVVLKVFFWWF